MAYLRSLFILFIALPSGCSMCGNDPINAEISPNEQRVAIAFLRNCGATTPFSTQVSILDTPGKLPNEAGNIFIVEGRQAMSVRWKNDKELKIGGGSHYDKAFLRLSEYQGVRISYE